MDEGVELIKGTLRAKRLIEVLHNINPEGGVTELDMRAGGVVDGLGAWDLRIVTDCVGVFYGSLTKSASSGISFSCSFVLFSPLSFFL